MFIRGNDINFDTDVDGCDDVENLLTKIEEMKMCPGFISNSSQQWSPKCLLHIVGKSIRCKYCSYKNKNKNKTKCLLVKSFKLRNKRAQQARRLSKRVRFLSKFIKNLKK